MKKSLNKAIKLLLEDFPNLNWNFQEVVANDKKILCSSWPGNKDEEIMICASDGLNEQFHRQDFFFFNYAYKNNYKAKSARFDNEIMVKEGECYIGQPFAGYSLLEPDDKDVIIIGILIQKEVFFRTFLSALSGNPQLFNFFLKPKINKYSDEFIHIDLKNNTNIKPIIDMMILEYANKKEDTQYILKPLVLALFMHVMREYKKQLPQTKDIKSSDKILRYINEHLEFITLKDIAKHFSYHPNYISSLLHKELGKTFSEIILDARMERASILLTDTNLSVEEIASITGYSNSSNFYKAFKEYYNCSPRKFKSTSRIKKISWHSL